jgi:predicted RNase H-like nuclease (RuvC/YqgF family)
MKKVVRILAAVIILFSAIAFVSCGGTKEKEVNPLADSLAGDNANLKGELTEKEQALQDFVNGFNEIQANLDEIKAKEKIVSGNTQSGDVKSKEEQIKADIQSIYDLMGKNKSRIASLNKKLKNANTKIAGLEQMIANLEAQLNEKDVQIGDLKNKIEQLNIELSNITVNYQNVEQESAVKTEKLNTAYYVIGTGKELKQKGVTEKEGGFIGLGKTTELKKDFNKDYFTKIDASQTTSIPIGAKKIKIITVHPSGAYRLIGVKPVEKLEITNIDEFWGASKYLVIVIE